MRDGWGHGGRRGTVAPAAVLLALATLLFWRPLFGGETLYFRDLLLFFSGQRRSWAAAVAGGHLPLWNPLFHGGMPLLGDVASSALYPSALLHLLLPTLTALNLELALAVALSALATVSLARAVGCSPPAALLAGAIYGFSGYELSQVNLFVRALALPWTPLLALCWYRAESDGGRRWWLAAAVAAALQLFAGAPEAVMMSFTLITGLALARRRPAAAVARVALLGLATAALAAVQLLPLVETLRQSPRGGGFSFAAWSAWSLSVRRLPELVVPGFLGHLDRLREAEYWGAPLVDNGFPYVLSVYFGAVALLLALCGAIGGALPRRLRWPLAGLAVGGLLLSLGRDLPGMSLLWVAVRPLAVFRFPSKLLGLAVLPVAVLAAAGLEVAVRDPGWRRFLRRALTGWTALALAVAGALVAAGEASRPLLQAYFRGPGPISVTDLAVPFVTAAAVAVAALLALGLAGRRGAAAAWLLALVVAAELVGAGAPVNRSAPRDWFREPPLVGTVRRVAGDGRLYRAPLAAQGWLDAPDLDPARRYAWQLQVLQAYRAATFGIPMVYHQDFDSLAPRRIVRLTEVLEGLPWSRRHGLLAAAGVTAVIGPRDLPLPQLIPGQDLPDPTGQRLYRHLGAIPDGVLVTRWLLAPSPRSALGALLHPAFDPRRHAVVEGAAPPALSDCEEGGTLRWLRREVAHQELAVDSRCPALVVLPATWYPGWRATVDGRPVPSLRANYAFSAIPVPAGSHRVERRYRPRSLAAGAASSAVAWAALAACAWLWRQDRAGGA